MATLQTFDQALSDSTAASGNGWSDERLGVVAELAAKLSEEELGLLRVIWPDRSLVWQEHCAEVLGSARLDEAIELLMDMLDRAKPEVALAALESLREFDPRRFTREQTKSILAALKATLERSVAPLHRVVLEAFLATLRSTGGPLE